MLIRSGAIDAEGERIDNCTSRGFRSISVCDVRRVSMIMWDLQFVKNVKSSREYELVMLGSANDVLWTQCERFFS